jgi:putative oxidoreductase
MIQQWYKLNQADPANQHRGMDIVRIGVALIILMHPLHGYTHLANIPKFGEFLAELGYPFGTALAWLVLLVQTASSLALLANRLVVPACIGHIIVVCFGLLHVHSHYGWYVVGPGQGGMEWGFILLTSLLGVMWAYWPQQYKKDK